MRMRVRMRMHLIRPVTMPVRMDQIRTFQQRLIAHDFARLAF